MKQSTKKVALLAFNPGGGVSVANGCLEAAIRTDEDLCDHVEVKQYNIDLEHAGRRSFDLPLFVLDLLAEGPDVLCLSCFCWNHDLNLEIVSCVSRLRPEVDLIVGGPEVSCNAPELLLPFSEGTFFVQGEGEVPLTCLLREDLPVIGRSTDGLPAGVGVLLGGEVRWSKRGAAPTPVERIASPLIAGTLELGQNTWHPGFATRRGCLFQCPYCRWGDGHGTRELPLGRVLEELRILGGLGLEHVWVVDSIFGQSPQRDFQIIEAMTAWPASMRVSFEIHPAFVSEELVLELKRLNLGWVALGVQTMGHSAQRTLRRKGNVKQIQQSIQLLYENLPRPSQLHIDLIFGLPGDTVESLLVDLDSLKATFPRAYFYCSLLQVLPGTPFWNTAREKGWVLCDARRGHELVVGNGIGRREAAAIKRTLIGIDFLQHADNRDWHLGLIASGARFSELAAMAGKCCVDHGIAWHIKDRREFFFDSLFHEKPALREEIARSVEEAWKRRRPHGS